MHNWARAVWSVGCFFFLAHVATAFHFYHAWSHDAAVLETARQSAEVVGVEAGYGIYMNYLFALLWIVDAGWWWSKGHSGYLGRAKAMSVSIHGYLLFIVINGTLVFEGGLVRWFSVLALVLLFGLWLRNKTNLKGHVTETV